MIREIAGDIGRSLLRFSLPQQRSTRQIFDSFLYSFQNKRQTRDSESNFGGIRGYRGIVPPPDYQSDWMTLDIDELTVNMIPTDRLLVLLNAVSPEISKACWDFQQFANSSWTFTTETEAGYRATEAFMDRIAQNGVSLNTLFDKLYASAFVRGAYFFEMPLQGRTPVGLAVCDPILAKVRTASEADKRRGKDFEYGQMIDGEFRAFRGETVVYAPVNSQVTTGYGIPLINSSVFAAVFMIGLLYDIRRVISQQGYYRLDFSYDIDMMNDKMRRAGISGNDPDEVDAFIEKQLDRLRTFYDQLNPSDSIVHTSDIDVGDIAGAMNAQGLGALNAVIDLLRNQLTLACKSVPILMGINNSTSETHANRQWENYMGTIRSCQRTLVDKLDKIFTLALRYQGIQDRVKFQFRELSATTAMILAQTEIATLESLDKALNMSIKTTDENGREMIGTPVDLMTPEQAKERWQQVGDLR